MRATERQSRGPRRAFSLIAQDLIAWTQALELDDELATCEPKSSATGCCTLPPDSPSTPAAQPCASKPTGPGASAFAAAFTRIAALLPPAR